MRIRKLILYSLILAINLLFVYPATAQNKTDANGKKQGVWVKYKNGSKFYEGQFVDDIPVGEFLYYYPNGKLKIKTIYSDNGRHNRTKVYFDSYKKNVQAEGNYFDKKKDSTWNYYNSANYLVATENYKKGLKHGAFKVFNHVGQLNLERYFENDTLVGQEVEYFETGSAFRLITYEKGKRTGAFKLFYPDGNELLVGDYKLDLREGKWTTFTKEGEIEYLDYYVKGILQKRTNKEGKELDFNLEEDTTPLDIDPSVFDSSALKR